MFEEQIANDDSRSEISPLTFCFRQGAREREDEQRSILFLRM